MDAGMDKRVQYCSIVFVRCKGFVYTVWVCVSVFSQWVNNKSWALSLCNPATQIKVFSCLCVCACEKRKHTHTHSGHTLHPSVIQWPWKAQTGSISMSYRVAGSRAFPGGGVYSNGFFIAHSLNVLKANARCSYGIWSVGKKHWRILSWLIINAFITTAQTSWARRSPQMSLFSMVNEWNILVRYL